MKNYICYEFSLDPLQPAGEILVSALADLDFESFEDTETGLRAYISEADDRTSEVAECAREYADIGVKGYRREVIPGQNWNAVWEADYPSVRAGDAVLVRAPFHPADPGVETEVVISPKMSFGTGHHATTRLMLLFLADTDVRGRRIADVGCGTGVLAIAAVLRGAAAAKAVDIEDIAVENTEENAALNGVKIDVEKGGAEAVAGLRFDLILANINKNVLCRDMSVYSKSLNEGGTLLLSGFFTSDTDEVRASAGDCGLKFEAERAEDGWASLKFIKTA